MFDVDLDLLTGVGLRFRPGQQDLLASPGAWALTLTQVQNPASDYLNDWLIDVETDRPIVLPVAGQVETMARETQGLDVHMPGWQTFPGVLLEPEFSGEYVARRLWDVFPLSREDALLFEEATVQAWHSSPLYEISDAGDIYRNGIEYVKEGSPLDELVMHYRDMHPDLTHPELERGVEELMAQYAESIIDDAVGLLQTLTQRQIDEALALPPRLRLTWERLKDGSLASWGLVRKAFLTNVGEDANLKDVDFSPWS